MAAVEAVGVVAAEQQIVAMVAEQLVVARQAGQEVAAAAAADEVGEGGAGEDVVVGAAVKSGHWGRSPWLRLLADIDTDALPHSESRLLKVLFSSEQKMHKEENE